MELRHMSGGAENILRAALASALDNEQAKSAWMAIQLELARRHVYLTARGQIRVKS